jgi:hypothetical protein
MRYMRSSQVDDGERPRTSLMADDLTFLRFAIADDIPEFGARYWHGKRLFFG